MEGVILFRSDSLHAVIEVTGILNDLGHVGKTFSALRTPTTAFENISDRTRTAAGGGKFSIAQGVAHADIHEDPQLNRDTPCVLTLRNIGQLRMIVNINSRLQRPISAPASRQL